MSKTLIAVIAAAAALTMSNSAFAYDGPIQHDRAQVRSDVVRLQQERAELRQAEGREAFDRQTGHPIKAWIAEKQVHREAADVRADRGQLARDRAQLARDRR